MQDQTRNNSRTWEKIYQTTSFGNKYPSSFLVSCFFNIIRKQFPCDRTLRVLDFGCSFGANAGMFRDNGCDVWGIDISPLAVSYCTDKLGFGKNRFLACNILADDRSVCEILDTEKFDVIVAADCLYYFAGDDLEKCLKKFGDSLAEGGVFYANMSTFRHSLYQNCADAAPDGDGMVQIEKSKTADGPLYMRFVKDKQEMRDIFHTFEEIAVLRTIEETAEWGGVCAAENESLHYFGRNTVHDKER